MSLHEKVKMDTEYRIIKHQHPAVSWGGLGVKVDSDLTLQQVITDSTNMEQCLPKLCHRFV